jgi:hypothetical protein
VELHVIFEVEWEFVAIHLDKGVSELLKLIFLQNIFIQSCLQLREILSPVKVLRQTFIMFVGFLLLKGRFFLELLL